MSLNSFDFIVYFAALVIVMGLLQFARRWAGSAGKIQLLVLLLFSYFFVLKSDWRFLLCILLVTAITYSVAIMTQRAKGKGWLVIGIVSLVIILAYFKYTNFFINSFKSLLGQDAVVLNIILPIGISFYVFSAIAYLVDVYRGEYGAEKSILNLSLFITFFPKLISGPIVRGKDFFPQIKRYRGIERDAFLVGIQVFVFGLFKKIVLADHLGVFVDDVFRCPTAFNTGTVILAAISYSLQIYFDFSGYSDMAIGIAKIMGFDFKANFNLPYVAQNASDFWKRWHISLSSWIRDYLYIPLGGSRKGNARTYVNLIVVMLISGLWHGAGWTFVVWGALHGLFSCVNKAFGKQLQKLGVAFNTILTFIVVTLFWVVFRASNFTIAMSVWTGMFTAHTGINQPYTWSFFAIACLLIGTLIARQHSVKTNSRDKNGKLVINGYYPLLDLSKFWHLVLFFTFCGMTIIMGYFGNTAFIYGAF